MYSIQLTICPICMVVNLDILETIRIFKRRRIYLVADDFVLQAVADNFVF